MTQLEKRDYAQLVAGTLGESASGERFTRKSPAHDIVVGSYPLAGVADVDLAVGAAQEAFDTGPWP